MIDSNFILFHKIDLHIYTIIIVFWPNELLHDWCGSVLVHVYRAGVVLIRVYIPYILPFQGCRKRLHLELVTHLRQAVQRKETMIDISIHLYKKVSLSGFFSFYAALVFCTMHMYGYHKSTRTLVQVVLLL